MNMAEVTQQSAIEAWFDKFISTLRSHQIQLETDTAHEELKQFYDTIFGGNVNELVHLGKSSTKKYFVPRIILDYLKLITKTKPLKLAFDHNDSEVLVWAEISDDDFELEKNLLKAEAIINAKYHDYGFDMETTIVEASDKLEIPNHYTHYKS